MTVFRYLSLYLVSLETKTASDQCAVSVHVGKLSRNRTLLLVLLLLLIITQLLVRKGLLPTLARNGTSIL